MNAWTGQLEARIHTEPLLQKQQARSLESNAAAATSIVPGLDGRLYSYTTTTTTTTTTTPAQQQQQQQQDFPQLQALPLTIHSILEHPVRSCPENKIEDCGILTATAHTSLIALDGQGQLLWKSQIDNDEWNPRQQQKQQESSLLLQRRDYWVQHVSIATGQQAWNVSLGTYQALDFGMGGSHGSGGGGSQGQQDHHQQQQQQPKATIDDDDDLSDDGEPPQDQQQLPSIIFSNEGHTLTVVDPQTEDVLWQQTTRNSVLSSVFGIHRGQWQTLNVLQEDEEEESANNILDDDDDDEHYALTRQRQQPPPDIMYQDDYDDYETNVWTNAAWEAARLQYRQRQRRQQPDFAFMVEPQKLLPSSPERQQQKKEQCLSGSCNVLSESFCLAPGECKPKQEFLLPPPSTTTTTMPNHHPGTVQPSGILVSWRIVEYMLVCFFALAVGLRQWYLGKKEKWLQENNSSSSNNNHSIRTTSLHLTPPSSMEHPLWQQQQQQQQEAFRRCSSMPESMANIPPFRNKSDPGEVLARAQSDSFDMKKNHSMLLPSSSSSEEKKMPSRDDSTKEVILPQGGIPLVRYSRYASEFEEMEAMGKGGFGTVFRCKNSLDGREYAIKKISIQGAVGDKSFQKRLQRVLREVKILAVLDHPNIVRYYTAWLEMEGEGDAPSDKKSNTTATRDFSVFGESTALSRRFSSSNLLSDSVSQWESESPARRGGPLYQYPPNPLGWDNNMFDENSASLRRDIHSGGEELSFMEESNDDFSGEHDETKTRDVQESKLAEEETETSYGADETSTRRDWDSRFITETSKMAGKSNTTKQTEEAPVRGSMRHTLYIQMQLCSERTVAEFLKDETARRGSADSGVDIPIALQLFLQICLAVQYVHEKGLIHRDLKPSNCFMDTTGSIKVGDFGLSRASACDDDAENSTLGSRRQSMAVDEGHTAGVGTRAYASPEQTNASDYDSSTDVYSLGIMLFELCYPMYTGMERNICLSRLRDFRFPEDWEKGVGTAFPTLKGLICSMLSKTPSTRPTADAIASNIQSILGEFTILSIDTSRHGPEVILLRVEAEHRDDALGHTIQLIRSASHSHSPVKVVQYGLRSTWSNEQPAAIMEFALHSSDPRNQGPELVAQLAKRPGIFKVRQVSHSSSISK